MANVATRLKPVWTVIWKVLLFFIIWGSLLAGMYVPMSSTILAWGKTQPVLARIYPDLVSLISILIATWIVVRFVEKKELYGSLFPSKNMSRDVAVGLAIGTAWLGLSLIIAALAGWLKYESSSIFSWASLYIAGVAVLLNVMTQQLLLNGYIFRTIKMHASPVVAVVISAIMFSGYHVGAFHGLWLPAVNVFLAGVLFCIASLVSENLWLPIGMHFAWNFLMGPALGLTVSGTDRLGSGWKIFSLHGPGAFTGGSFGLEGGVIVTIVTLLLIVLISRFLNREI
jgi:uncharacterized protein